MGPFHVIDRHRGWRLFALRLPGRPPHRFTFQILGPHRHIPRVAVLLLTADGYLARDVPDADLCRDFDDPATPVGPWLDEALARYPDLQPAVDFYTAAVAWAPRPEECPA